ncbi:Por secretion system C-terminal sorting domain-containing protein [Hymenobacter daecheongensis DSM 21074]|uniref:Por secretion system C-terminal sorting domain-containing protein n=1 Tax=Hymenobacter daecheongensis DSM 21074 TaxID=1121955 RepID=A0A1M6A975_9BACT|nr:YHYH protein [Hymenobacter daecheongensis]SHI33025.1 Por secretion system C-terminal sorting domain-containing protein [Hymenobacter daecheongensis DSM 21074]
MRKLLLLATAAAGLLPAAALAQATNPIVTSWLLNTNAAKGFNNQAANVTSVRYSATSVYLVCPRIPSYSLNYLAPASGQGSATTNSWFPQPTHGPSAQTCTAYNFRLPLTPTPNMGTPVSIPGGTIGVWINGTNMHPAKDAASYKTSTATVVNNGDGVWFTDAVVNEGIGFDACNGHPNMQDVYHTHVNPDCLYDRRDSTRHSPIIGYALDGYPVYGTYGYKNTDGTGGVKSMKSSYRQRSITQRRTLSDGTVLSASQYGPDVSTTHPLGKFVEDNEYVANLGDLDRRNGRWCVTPEYPAGTYAYFCTLNSLYEGTYPYTIAGTYYGTVPYTNDQTTATASLTETVTTYAPPASLTVSTSKVLAGGSFADVTVTGTGNLVLVQPLAVTGSLTVQSGGALDVGTLDPNTQTVSGAGTFSLASGARLTLDDAAGLSGSGATGAVQTTGTRTFDGGATYVYSSDVVQINDGAAAQSTGTGLPAALSGQLVVNNTAGVTLSQNTSISGTLDLATPSTNTTVGSGTLTLGSGRTLTVVSGGTVRLGRYPYLTGAGSFALASGASLYTAHASGLVSSTAAGSLRTTVANRSLSASATYAYNGTVAQTTGSGLPATVGSFSLHNAAGLTLTNNLAVTGTATFGSGNLASNGKTLTLGSGATAIFSATPAFTGAGGFVLGSGATLKTANPDGLTSSGSTGSVQSTTRSFSPDAAYAYNGTAAQVTGTGLPPTVASLTVDNAAGVALSAATTITNALTMTTGVLSTGSNTATLGTAAGSLSESATSYVTGRVQQTKDLSTAGTATNFGNLGLTLTPAGGILPGTTTVVRTTGTALSGQGTSQSIKRYYDIVPATNAGLSVTVEIGYADAELNGIAEARLGIFRSTTGTAGPWQNVPSSARDASANTITATGVEHFSVWTLGSSANPLPVELVRFTAEAAGAGAVLRWATAQEVNNDRFEVESSADGHAFRHLGTLAGHGTSPQRHDYQFLDLNLARYAAPLVYYRLRQVDANGTAHYSPVAVVAAGAEAATQLLVYPNPAGSHATVRVVGPGPAALVLLDALGRPVWRGTGPTLPLPGLAAGVYTLRCQTPTETLTRKLVVE